MTTAKKATAPSKGAVARAEVTAGRTIKFRGLTLNLPAEMPFVVLKYIGAIEPGPSDLVGVMNALLGDEQCELIWNLPDLDMKGGNDLIDELILSYGTTAEK